MDPAHVRHGDAHAWFEEAGHRAWATCPMTENGAVRIVGHARYPNTPGTPAAVARLLRGMCAHVGHQFWPDDVSLLDGSRIDEGRLLSVAQVTDSYLLALAVAHGGKVATFDHRIAPGAVKEGERALHCLGTSAG